MPANPPRILFIHNGRTRFVQLDMEILKEHYTVTECYLRSKLVNPIVIWKQVAAHDLIFGWFASWHTLLPFLFARLLGKPSLLIIIGYDLANMPEINYGHQRGGFKKWASRWTMHMATCLVTGSYYCREEAAQNAGIPKDRVHVIYQGIPDVFNLFPSNTRDRMALTVGVVDYPNLGRKGHEPFVRAASLLPDVEFTLIGVWRDSAIDYLKKIATPNVTFTGWVDDKTLTDYYRRASVYIQASLHEGFGMSVAEAMLAGCIPVVTKAGSLPEVVGDCGIYVPSDQISQIAHAIEKALDTRREARMRGRRRILRQFPIENRQKQLQRLIRGLLNAN